MTSQIRRKPMITLVLSIMLAGGSYWIPAPSIATAQNAKLPPERVAVVDAQRVTLAHNRQ